MEIWLNFINKLIDSLIWPIIAIGFIFHFRKQIGELIKGTKSLKTTWGEIEFDKELDKVKAELGEVQEEFREEIPEREQSKLLSKQYQDHIVDLLVDSRSVAIQEAWREVEVAAANALKSAGGKPEEIETSILHQVLTKKGLLNAQQLKIYVQLRDLRNKAVRLGDRSISDSNALAFADLAIQLASLLERQSVVNKANSADAKNRAAG